MTTHATLVVHRPDIGKWQPWCQQCEDLGDPLDTEDEAWDVANGHQAGESVELKMLNANEP